MAGPAQGSLGASSQPPLPTHWKSAGGEVWEDEWYPCDGGPPAADPSSPEPQASGLRLPQRQCQTGPTQFHANEAATGCNSMLHAKTLPGGSCNT